MSRTAAALLSVSTLLGGFLAVTGSASAAAVVRDGTTFDRAAASCWAIKQLRPELPSGAYWLQTPELVTAQKFYCDQTTDGGGWVLVGRGREGWSFANAGQGGATALRTVPTGTGAFVPAALPSTTINGLLNGAAVSSLSDGVRVRRALSTDGARWQDLRLHHSSPAPWSWALPAGHRLRSVRLDGVTYSGDFSTRDWRAGTANDHTRFWTFAARSHKWRAGFAYGSTVAGINNSTSYLWQYTTEKHALPFTQVWLRPRLTEFDVTYPALASAGEPARAVRPLMKTRTAAQPWGVTGVVGGGTGEQNIEVQSFGSVGTTMFVGGKFEFVQKGAAPAAGEKIAQPYLAGFDINTGEWRSAFRPRLNGQVWDIQPTADGKLILGGEFSTVNGVSTGPLAAVDATTGELLPWNGRVSYAGTAVPRVRALDIQNGWLYVGGSFNRTAGGTAANDKSYAAAARFNVETGAPDTNWRPRFNRGVMELDASSRGDRVYLVGHFTTMNTLPANKLAVVTTSSPAALVPGLAPWKPNVAEVDKQYQQTVLEVGDSVWQGGSQHVLQRYDRNNYALQQSFVTMKGGDFQTAVEIDGVVYAACHCFDWVYTDTMEYPWPTKFGTAHDIKMIGAWDAVTGEYLPEFAISGIGARAGNGPWELTKDANGCMWFGGDINRGSSRQWLGGFGKVCPRDAVAPGAPASLKAVRTLSGVNLSWPAVTDNSGTTVRYEVLHNDRVLLTTTGLKYTHATGEPGTYWVRAIDATRNRSATTAGQSV